MKSEGCGYDYNDGGINNQKLALIGLVSHVSSLESQEDRKLYLPLIYNKDQHDKISSLENFGDVFWLDIFAEFLSRWSIELVQRPTEFVSDRMIAQGWNYFAMGAGRLGDLGTHSRDRINRDISADLLRSLVPRVRSSIFFQNIADQIFRIEGIQNAVQFRIEEDWLHHTVNWEERIGTKEDVYINGENIIQKLVNTIVDSNKSKVYVTCDERYIFKPKWEIKEEVKKLTGVEIIFKSDIADSGAYQNIKPIDASLVDFEIVKMATNFVGNSRSTFANLASFERCIGTYRPQGRDYIYNLPGESLGLRKDMGTKDNPLDATK